MLARTALWIALPLTLALGCNVPEPTSPDEGLSKIRPPQPPDLGRGPDRVDIEVYSMYVHDTVRTACAGSAPFFSFASAKTTVGDDATMNVLAQCMKTGALKGKTILLVGHTDPRGSEGYNEKLGLERAERVKSYLVAHGVDDNHLRTASVGKDDAKLAPANWSTDRRVEIRLAE